MSLNLVIVHCMYGSFYMYKEDGAKSLESNCSEKDKRMNVDLFLKQFLLSYITVDGHCFEFTRSEDNPQIIDRSFR